VPKGSSKAWAPWEKEAARAGCVYCGKRVLNKDAHGTMLNHRTGKALAWHADCAPRMRLVRV